jgi:hypothetical protein
MIKMQISNQISHRNNTASAVLQRLTVQMPLIAANRPLTAANRTRIFMLQFLLHGDPPSCPHHSIARPICQSGWMIDVNYTANSLVAKQQKNFFHFMEAIALQGNIYVL